jgi:hypothetical protein
MVGVGAGVSVGINVGVLEGRGVSTNGVTVGLMTVGVRMAGVPQLLSEMIKIHPIKTIRVG